MSNKVAGINSTVKPGLLLFAFFTGLLKAYVVSSNNADAGQSVAFIRVLVSDLSFLFFCGVLTFLSPFADWTFTRLFIRALLLLCVIFYAFDTYLIWMFDQRFSVDDTLKYSDDLGVIMSFVGVKALLIVLLALIALLFRVQIDRIFARNATVFSLASLFLAGLLIRPLVGLERYETNLPSMVANLTVRNVADRAYTNFEVDYYSQNSSLDVKIDLPSSKPNIIFIVMESVSSLDSKRFSGLADYLPKLDKVSRNGKIFTNFIANYHDSEGGIISMLSGTPPLPYPTGTRNLFNSYSIKDAVPADFKRHGYNTELVISQPITWNNMQQYFSRIGFDLFQGRDEIERFQNAPRFTFDSPEDALLYDELLERSDTLKQLGKPYFLAALTVSSHLPWTDPLGRGDTEENVWSYVDDKIASFYDRLVARNFFTDGILIITGDHRKMAPILRDERIKYGASAVGRIPLIIIGKDVPTNKVDTRQFQQSDLFRKLEQAINGNEALSPMVIYVERFTNPNLRVTNPGDIQIFEEVSNARVGYRAFVKGNDLTWLDDKATLAREAEFAIHSQRALLQAKKAKEPPTCRFDKPDSFSMGSSLGLTAGIFKSREIGGAMDKMSTRFASSRIIPTINFPENLSGVTSMTEDFSLEIEGFLLTPTAGEYWFKLESDDGSCLAINEKIVIDGNEPKAFSPLSNSVYLSEGAQRIAVRYYQGGGEAGLVLSWIKPGDKDWEVIPESALRVAAPSESMQ